MGDTKVSGEFLEIDPPRRLAYTWSSSWMPKSTKVLWELENQRWRYVREDHAHSGFAGDAEQATTTAHGWNQGHRVDAGAMWSEAKPSHRGHRGNKWQQRKSLLIKTRSWRRYLSPLRQPAF